MGNTSDLNQSRTLIDYKDEFFGKRVLITGAAGVIGGWIADAFACRGADLFLTDRRVELLESQRSGGRWKGVDVSLQAVELTDRNSMESLVEEVRAKWIAPDILINNAGIYPHKPLLEWDLQEWREIMDINVAAPFFLSSRLSELMIAAGKNGSIVNILSGASKTVSKNGVPYSVSKAALEMFTRGASLELAEFGIRVNGVAPGFAPGSEISQLDDDYIESMVRSIPLGRSSGPNDSSEAVVFLCSSSASFITGSVVTVDGGRTAGPVSRK